MENKIINIVEKAEKLKKRKIFQY